MNKRYYYLDTVSIRRAGWKLGTLDNPSEYYTSGHTIHELLNGVRKNAKEYSVRSNSIKNLRRAGIDIDWTLPHGHIGTAFDELDFVDERLESLRMLHECIITSANLTDFVDLEARLKLRFPIDYWEQLDDTNGPEYIEATVAGNVDVRKVFDQHRETIDSLIPDHIRSGPFVDFCRFCAEDLSLINHGSTILAIATDLANYIFDGEPSDDHIEKIFISYNDSIDTYVRAFSHVSMTDLAGKNRPGRNALNDLDHFLYIHKHNVLISEDEGMRKVAAAIGIQTAGIESMFRPNL